MARGQDSGRHPNRQVSRNARWLERIDRVEKGFSMQGGHDDMRKEFAEPCSGCGSETPKGAGSCSSCN